MEGDWVPQSAGSLPSARRQNDFIFIREQSKVAQANININDPIELSKHKTEPILDPEIIAHVYGFDVIILCH